MPRFVVSIVLAAGIMSLNGSNASAQNWDAADRWQREMERQHGSMHRDLFQLCQKRHGSGTPGHYRCFEQETAKLKAQQARKKKR